MLSERDRTAILDQLSDEEIEAFLFDWPEWARPEQMPPAGEWRIWLVLSGRGFGKTRLGAEWVRAQVRDFEYVNLIGKSTDDVRDVMIEGESGILSVCPPHEKPVYNQYRRLLKWPNGARTLCFTAEEPEQLRGPQHQRLWGDEFAKWQYPREAFDLAMFGLRLGPDPRALLTSTPKPIAMLRELVEDPKVTITKGTTYENRLNLAPEFFESLISKYEGTRLGRQELEAELLLDEGLAYRVTDGVHVVPEFPVPNAWTRFEAMDYGTQNPTSWGCFASDYDGNVVAFGLLHEPGFPSETAPRIFDRRERWWSRGSKGELLRATCYAPADIRTRFARSQITGKEVSAETEFNELGIHFARAQQDRRAGYIRISEMLKLDDTRRYPDWHPKAREPGAPRLFILDTDEMQPLITALRDAPLEDVESPISKLPGEAVEEEWEHREGHAHAMLRYALMSRPRPTKEPKPIPEDPRALRVAQRLEAIKKREERDLTDV
jgi:hypothetical protein